jgi:23S rRNA pseudouridine2604 synthase
LAKIRLSKLMAEQSLCSRREADVFIARGWVYVDGERVTTLGVRVDPGQTVSLDPQARDQQRHSITILLNKPVGFVSGQPEKGYPTAISLITPGSRFRGDRSEQRFRAGDRRQLAPAGRLDIDSSGLLVLTQDGRIARRLISPESKIEKEYLVRVEGALSKKEMSLLRYGLSLDGRKLKPARVSWVNARQLRFVLTEGRKRQIRRMCELVGLHVTALKRVRIGKVRLANLPTGQWRFLRKDEEF